jgi:hypothetical protein
MALPSWVAAGCGGAPAGGAALGPVPLDQLTSALLDAECVRDVRCHSVSDVPLCHQLYAAMNIAFIPGALVGLTPEGNGRADFNSVAAIVAAASAGKAHYDPAAARACLDAVAAVNCGAIREGPPALGGACQNVFTGTVANGGACIHDLECVAGSFCADTGTCSGTCTLGGPNCNFDSQCASGELCDFGGSTTASAGRCMAAAPPGAAGEACGTNFRCQADVYCTFGGTCQAAGQEGQPCDLVANPFTVCAGGLMCVPDDTRTTGTCMKPAAEGETCQLEAQCGGIITSLTCDEIQHRCVDWKPGGPCTHGCPPDAACDNSASPPTCNAALPLGSACTTQSGKPDPCSSTQLNGSCVHADPTSLMGVCTSSLAPTCTP